MLTLTEVSDLARTLMNAHGLNDWVFKFDGAKQRLGSCKYSKKRILLSRHLVTNPVVDISTIKNTILHEIAHAIVGIGNNHNHTWKSKALSIGCDAERCTEIQIALHLTRKHWACTNPGCKMVFPVFRNRGSLISAYRCGKCKSKLVEVQK